MRHRRWLGYALLVSVLLHVVPALVLLLFPPPRRMAEPLPEAGVAMVFEGGTGEQTQSSQAGEVPQPQAPSPEAPSQAAETPPAPEVPPEPETDPEPEPPQPTPEPPQPQPTPDPPPPAPDPPRPTPPAPPRVSVFPPPDSPPDDVPPLFSDPPPPAPQPQARPSPYAGLPMLPRDPFATPARPAQPSRPRPPQRGIDLSLGPVMPPPRPAGGQGATDTSLSIRGAELGSDWRAAFREWLERHAYYPQQAAAMGHEGPATVRFKVDRYGKVRSVELIRQSGSQWLDAATLSLLRGRTLPPFPPGTAQDEAEIDLTVNYILRRR